MMMVSTALDGEVQLTSRRLDEGLAGYTGRRRDGHVRQDAMQTACRSATGDARIRGGVETRERVGNEGWRASRCYSATCGPDMRTDKQDAGLWPGPWSS
jgi:hypothetical protein